MKEVLRRAHRAGTRYFRPALAALVGKVQNSFSSLYNISLILSRSPSKLKAGSRTTLPVS